jgi:hypothetical protein
VRRIDLEAVIGVITAADAAITIFGNDADDRLALRRGAFRTSRTSRGTRRSRSGVPDRDELAACRRSPCCDRLANRNRFLLLCQLAEGEKSVGELAGLLQVRSRPEVRGEPIIARRRISAIPSTAERTREEIGRRVS